jgi:hypothetical protein
MLRPPWGRCILHAIFIIRLYIAMLSSRRWVFSLFPGVSSLSVKSVLGEETRQERVSHVQGQSLNQEQLIVLLIN